ncbi:Hsp70 family protein [Streptomyces sp. NPDC057002]|uniref:Hsp70 family protein n=1 Tax=Streptomyces sp. NPDC057002 TaxID=3345992 RepID=UPI0036279D78
MSGTTTESVLAIDFGTTSTCAALARGGTVHRLREPVGDGWCWPSAVLFDGTMPYVGTAAERRRRLAPAAYRDEIKRTLGRGTPVDLAGRGHRPGLLVSLLFQAVRAEAERVGGGPVSRTVLTVPATYGPADPRRDELLGAARSAGLPGVELCPEPVAAALAPLAGGPLPPGTTVLVHDFGGGTFDTALVRLAAGKGEDGADTEHTVLAHGGVERGGRDVDGIVLAELRAQGGPELDGLLTPPEGEPTVRALRHRMELLDLARQLKHRLAAESAPSDVFTPAERTFTLHRDRVVELARPLYELTTGCCARLLAETALLDSSGRPPKADAVVVVGGSSRLPGLTAHVEEALGLPLHRAEDPRTAVAEGAAAWGRARAVRTVLATGPVPGRTPLCWALPPGTSTLVDWYVAPGARYEAGAVLGRVRAEDGSLLQLSAPSAGRVRAHHARPGDRVRDGEWLLTVVRGDDG